MRLYVGITDNEWFSFLAKLQPDEVNFWLPSEKQRFAALDVGEPFLFKLHAPVNYITGGGFFVTYRRMPLSLAWRAFGEKNGVSSEADFRKAINWYRYKGARFEYDPVIGNVILTAPFFFQRSEWIPVPNDWSRSIVRGKTYDTSESIGANLWYQVQTRIDRTEKVPVSKVADVPLGQHEYGRRLGEGAFRVLVTEACHRRCAITGEKTLPVLQPTHIKPLRESGTNETCNGLLLRADYYILFDQGYFTVTPDYHLEVSRRIKEDYENGREYHQRHGSRLLVLPDAASERPSADFLSWHNENVYLG